jgi:uncharacterized protein YndB with AHSA1/START domain
MSALIIQKSIEVTAPVATLWKVLTDEQFIPQYMFGCNAETDWKPGSPLLWRGAADGKVYVKGTIVSINPPRQLAYTIFDPNSTIPDVPENYLAMTYELRESGDGASTLEITQGDFALVADGQNRYRHSLQGYDFILEGIKKLAEAAA